ncbi:MAG: DUF2752 domain-containing protein [Prevotellaceae bacterium]|jgi:hypothetical protein|nr:DUF2752 domain-containing protein [Prevotellaceae bacterium]
MNGKTAITSAIILSAGTVIAYFSYNPEKTAFFPPCPFYKLTGLKCPGCGSQRAIHSLLHLDVKQAFFYNPALFFAVPLAGLLIYLGHCGGQTRFPKLYRFLSGTKFIMGIFIAIMLYWIGRNICF